MEYFKNKKMLGTKIAKKSDGKTNQFILDNLELEFLWSGITFSLPIFRKKMPIIAFILVL